MNKLNLQTTVATILLALVMGALIFLPAGTVDYWQGWVFLAVFFGVTSMVTLYLMRNDPALLRRRIAGGPTAEKEGTQRVIMSIASVGFIAALVVPGLDHRFRWTSVPTVVVLLGDALIALSYLGIFFVFRENTFTAATVQVMADQKVISTGPYSIVRHPMYAAGSLLFLGMPLALGSYWGLIPAVLAIPAIIWRLLDEERLLTKNLPGYAEYSRRLRWRLIPHVF